MDDPLSLERDAMRQLGYRAVDLAVDAYLDVETPPIRRATPSAMAALLDAPPPEAPDPEALERLFTDVLPYIARLDHPRYFAFIPCSGTWPGALGDFVASALSVYVASWLEGAGPTQLELTVLGWFKQWIGYPADADGLLTSGGSMSNLTALACARESRVGAMRDDLVLYVPDQAHSSTARAARALGFRPEQVRVLPTDQTFRLRPETLAAAVDADHRRGLVPLLASVTAGATNTGAVDPLVAVAEICRSRGVWLHVDAAYGGFGVLTERGRAQLAGLELADSITLDPHKWLYQPYECGCVLTREPNALRRAFEVVPPYLRDIHAEASEVNLSDHGLQLSRTSRAFKIWLSIRHFGLAAFRDAVDRSLDHAAHAVERIEASPSFELLAPPSLGIVCFRRTFPGVTGERELARLNARLAADLEESGIGFVSSTTLRGRYALRLCPMNHLTTREHVDAALDFLETAMPSPGEARPGESDRDAELARSWLRSRPLAGGAAADASALAGLDVFADLAPADRGSVAALAALRHVEQGATIVREWDVTRDFYIVLEGTVTVRRDGIEVAQLGPGEFFGELAALDWGSGYGYARTATVEAATPARLLEFPEGTLDTLMRLSRRLGDAVGAAVTERLPGSR